MHALEIVCVTRIVYCVLGGEVSFEIIVGTDLRFCGVER